MALVPPLPSYPGSTTASPGWSTGACAAHVQNANLCSHLTQALRQEEGDQVHLISCRDMLDHQLVPLLKTIASELRRGGAWDWVEGVCGEVARIRISLVLAIDADTDR